MEIVGIFIAGTMVSALVCIAFWVGYMYGQKNGKDGVTVTDNNKDFIEEMQRWRNFSGR